MRSNFKQQYPDFASIEHHIRQAHAERSVAIATGFADAIVAVVRWIGGLFGPRAVARNQKGDLLVKASIPRNTAA